MIKAQAGAAPSPGLLWMFNLPGFLRFPRFACFRGSPRSVATFVPAGSGGFEYLRHHECHGDPGPPLGKGCRHGSCHLRPALTLGCTTRLLHRKTQLPAQPERAPAGPPAAKLPGLVLSEARKHSPVRRRMSLLLLALLWQLGMHVLPMMWNDITAEPTTLERCVNHSDVQMRPVERRSLQDHPSTWSIDHDRSSSHTGCNCRQCRGCRAI